jgi:hypothetical protein
MLANVNTVKQIVKAATNMSSGYYSYRRIWQDKNKKDATLRNVAFRFWDGNEATRVANVLSNALAGQGYTNKVTRTSTHDKQRDVFDRRIDSYYVRVTTLA